MGLIRSLRKLGLQSILSSALNLEEEIYNLYGSLKAELAGLKVPQSLAHIIDEELGHQRLIQDICQGRIGDREIDNLMKGTGPHIHDPDTIEALPVECYTPILQRLETILEKERKIHGLFASLHRKAKIPFAKRAFAFLEDQEHTHVLVLEKLLGIGTS
jgi:rubrerythrin